MNEIELKKLWTKLQSQPKDFGTFEEFKSKMSTPEMRKRFYDKFFNELKSNGFNLGDYTAYEKRLSNVTPTAPKPNVNDINTYPPCVRFGEPEKDDTGKVVGIKGLGRKYSGMIFFNNGRYRDKDGQVKSYSCNTVKTSSGVSYELNLQPKTSTGSTTGSTTPTKSTVKKKTSQYRQCKNFPFTKWCKHEKIKDIQKWIGFPTKYQTGNFGPITERGLKDLKIDISKGITLDIYDQIKTEHLNVNSKDDNPEPTLIPNADVQQNEPSDLKWER